VRQLTIQYDIEQAAGGAVKRLVPEASCRAQKLSLDAGDQSWAGRHIAGTWWSTAP
jgi:hypothetical protein